MSRALSCGERAILSQDGPEDEPAPTFSRVRHIKSARKPHPCGHCDGGHIARGEPYIEYVAIDAGRFERETYCTGGKRCPALMRELAGLA